MSEGRSNFPPGTVYIGIRLINHLIHGWHLHVGPPLDRTALGTETNYLGYLDNFKAPLGQELRAFVAHRIILPIYILVLEQFITRSTSFIIRRVQYTHAFDETIIML